MIKKSTGFLRPDLKEVLIEKPFNMFQSIAAEILPESKQMVTGGNIRTIPAGQDTQVIDNRRAPGGTFKRHDFVDSEESFSTFQYGNEAEIDDVEELEVSDFFNMENIVSELARNRMLVAREKRVINAVTDTTTFAAVADHFDITTQWTNLAATPLADIDAAALKLRAKMGLLKSSLTLTLDELVFESIVKCTEIKDALKYTTPVEVMTLDQKAALLRTYLGVNKVRVAGAQVNTQALGADAVFGGIWPQAKMLLSIDSPAGGTISGAGLGYQPVYAKFSPDYRVEHYDEPERAQRVIRVREYRGTLVRPKFGVLLLNSAA